ncbi:hypothetical protein IO98_06790 [Lacrimispora celerecrescens]|uniref:Uncharacterized protein n=1 Tax=Lacrimispora celerecrescens TaxID=29354 RepID=A0A084JPD1_9FIRM|nr:hypothetical protein IO98_06790 [Lacrimispora celerecrescens]
MPVSDGFVTNKLFPAHTRETIRVFLSLKPPACSVYLPERSDTAFFVGRIPARKQHPGWPWEILIDDTNLESIKTLYT